MYCPFCSALDTKVIDSRLVSDGHQVRRRSPFQPGEGFEASRLRSKRSDRCAVECHQTIACWPA